jgi:hypothetical protein
MRSVLRTTCVHIGDEFVLVFGAPTCPERRWVSPFVFFALVFGAPACLEQRWVSLCSSSLFFLCSGSVDLEAWLWSLELHRIQNATGSLHSFFLGSGSVDWEVCSGVLVLRFGVAGVGVLVTDLLLFSFGADLVFTFACFWRW